MNGHRVAIALESALLGIPTTAFLLIFGPLMAFGVIQEPSGLGLTMLLVIVLSAVALVCFWRLAFVFVARRGHATRLWWRGTALGVVLVAGSAATVGLGSLGLEIPESLVPLAFGAYGAPVLVPLLHMWLVREQFQASPA